MSMDEYISKVLKSHTGRSDMLNVMEALGFGSDRFQLAFDIALEMENRNLVKPLYSNFSAGKIVVEFTRLGRQYREDDRLLRTRKLLFPLKRQIEKRSGIGRFSCRFFFYFPRTKPPVL